MTVDFKATFTPSLDELGKARQWVGESLQGSVNEELLNQITLCLSELMANTVDYARPAANEIGVRLSIKDDEVCMEIEDDGASFINFDHAVEAVREAHDSPTLDDRGRGLYLVGNMCPNLSYRPKNDALNSFNKTILIYDTASQ